MTKWICIDSCNMNTLTLNKVYDGYIVETDKEDVLCIIDNKGEEYLYYKNRFMSLDEWREKQIKSVIDG